MEAIFKLKNYKRLSINHIKLFIDNLLFQKIIPQAGRHDLYLNKGAVRIPFTKVAYLDMLEIFSKCIVNIYMTDTVIIFNGYDIIFLQIFIFLNWYLCHMSGLHPSGKDHFSGFGRRGGS